MEGMLFHSVLSPPLFSVGDNFRNFSPFCCINFTLTCESIPQFCRASLGNATILEKFWWDTCLIPKSVSTGTWFWTVFPRVLVGMLQIRTSCLNQSKTLPYI